MKVAVFSTMSYEAELLNSSNKLDKHQLTFFEESLTEENANLAKGNDAVCLFVKDLANEKVVENLSKLGVKLIDLRSAGYDYVDLLAASRNNISVMHVPAYSPQAIAEHAVALILTLNRKTHKAYNRTRSNNFTIDNLMGFNLYGKTVGVVGTGRIGKAFSKIMLGFGCTVIAYDIVFSNELIKEGVVYVTFDELLNRSDIISIHCPLNTSTRHLFNTKVFSKMKRNCMLINTGRGAVINTLALIHALKNKLIAAFGMDVYEYEQGLFFKDFSNDIVSDNLIEILLSFGNVLVTPHQSYFTLEAVTEIAKTTIQNFTDFEKGEKSNNRILAVS